MHVASSILLLVAGAGSGIAFVLSCGDDLSAKANADTAIDSPKAPDAAPTCDCPPFEPPIAGRIVVVNQTLTIAGNRPGRQSAVCPVGSQLFSGSCSQDLLNPVRNITLQESGFFEFPPREWTCSFHNNESSPVAIRVSIICLKPMP
jgi:hypothetical protein